MDIKTISMLMRFLNAAKSDIEAGKERMGLSKLEIALGELQLMRKDLEAVKVENQIAEAPVGAEIVE